MPLFGGEDTEACAFVVSEPHPYTSAESPYATPHNVSIPEECPMAENTFKILSAEGRPVRLLTARLKWCCTEQSKKARLISLVSKRREVISDVYKRQHGEFVDFDIQEALNMTKDIPEEQYEIAKMLIR